MLRLNCAAATSTKTSGKPAPPAADKSAAPPSTATSSNTSEAKGGTHKSSTIATSAGRPWITALHSIGRPWLTSNPELWRALNAEFVGHGYDLKHVMRLIMNSRTYQLSSATVPGNATERRFYSHYYARRLPAEVLMDAMSQATGVPDKFDGYPLGARAIQLPEPGVASYFLTLFGRSDRVTACACERSGAVTLPQLLHLQSGDELTKKLRASDGRLIALLKDKDDARVSNEIFLSTLARPPSADEQAAFNKALAAGGARDEVYADLFWALLNTKEFAFNH